MKKLISVILVFVLVSAALSVSVLAGDDGLGGMTGGWSPTESPEITEDVQALMDLAMEGLLGADYVPVAYLGTQVVAGTNHCILCQARAVSPEAEPYYALVILYEDLSGNAEILDIKALDIGDVLAAEAADDGQNPVMNFIGEYQCDRAHALVECVGEDSAMVTIDWGGSAWESARWVIVGPLDTDTLTVAYSDCTKSILTYADGGELVSEEVEYEDGTGTIVFHEDGTFTWTEDASGREEDMMFQWIPVTPEPPEQREGFDGLWAEEIAGRCQIEFTYHDEGSVNADITWPGSAFQRARWEMTADAYKDDILIYEDGHSWIETYTDDDNYTVSEETFDETGSFYLQDGKLHWVNDRTGEDTVFIPA